MRAALVSLAMLSAACAPSAPLAIEVDAVPSSDWLILWTAQLRDGALYKEPRLCQEQLGKLVCRPLCGGDTGTDCIHDRAKGTPRTVFRGVRLVQTSTQAPKSFSLLERRDTGDRSEGIWLRVCSLEPTSARGSCFDSVIASGSADDRVGDPVWFSSPGRLDRIIFAYNVTHGQQSLQRVFECIARDDNRVVCIHLEQLERIAGFAGDAPSPAAPVAGAPPPSPAGPSPSTPSAYQVPATSTVTGQPQALPAPIPSGPAPAPP